MPPDAAVAPHPAPDLVLPGPVVAVTTPGGGVVAAAVVQVPADRVARLSGVRRCGLVVVPLTLVGLVWGGPSGFFAEIQKGLAPEPVAVAAAPPSGHALFAQNCAVCHGSRGDGNGVAALTTKARYFGAEPFKFTGTTGTHVPTDADLVALLKRGIAGSSMPSFAALRDEELQALVGHVRTLTRRGKYEALVAKAVKEFDDGGDPPDPVKLSHTADRESVIGAPLAVPAAFGPPTPASLANGKRIFTQSCAGCHGPEGLGNGPQVAQLVNTNGTRAVPRNLTTGVFKGGREKPHLYARIVLGIPGTPMPAGTTYTPDEVNDIMNYVLSLSDAPAGSQTAAR